MQWCFTTSFFVIGSQETIGIVAFNNVLENSLWVRPLALKSSNVSSDPMINIENLNGDANEFFFLQEIILIDGMCGRICINLKHIPSNYMYLNKFYKFNAT